jgi:hypothetical protein
MRRIPMPRCVPFLVVLWMTTASSTAADKAVLEQKLVAKYKLSTVNAEGDFVRKGTTLVLQKGGFTGGADPITCIHQYSNGKISLTGPSKAACTGAVRFLSKIPGLSLIPHAGAANQKVQGNAPTTRPFVAGEKLYMTKIEVVKDDIDLTLISDQVNSVRYGAEIRFHKAAKLETREAEELVAEVLKVGAGGGGGAKSASSPAAAPAETAAAAPAAAEAPAPVVAEPAAAPSAAPAEMAPAPIAAPPPPSDQPPAAPPAISPGMTIDQVVALLGQPQKIADLGSKKIYVYPDQKVTFIDGKVTPADDSTVTQTSSTPNLLPFGIGLGVLIVGAAAFLVMRSRRPAAMVPAAPLPEPPPMASSAPPLNLIQRLDELEKLKERGILTPAEFEREKAKLRSM